MTQLAYNKEDPNFVKQNMENKRILTCSKCGIDLITIIQTKNDVMPEEFCIKAVCGVCGDHSFEYKVNGLFRYSECENSLVCVKDIENDGTKVTIYTDKV